MKMLCLLLLVSVFVTEVAEAAVACGQKERGVLDPFKGGNLDVAFPCKYPALRRQKCGEYLVSVSAANKWLRNNYYLNLLWVSITKNNSEVVTLRLTNRIAVKYLNGDKPMPFGYMDGTSAKDWLVYSKDDVNKDVFIKEKYGVFSLTFEPWDPQSRSQYGHATFQFSCSAEDDVLNGFADQVCGGTSEPFSDYAKDTYGLSPNHAFVATYVNIFNSTASSLVQTEDSCIAAANIFRDTCTDHDRRLLVMKNCAPILNVNSVTQCVTQFECTPMDAFNACLIWGCTGAEAFEYDKSLDRTGRELSACFNLTKSIDLCPDISKSGTLSERSQDANCFKEYPTLKGHKGR